MQLNQQNLPVIAEEISRPNYDRSQLRTGIVHVGTGAKEVLFVSEEGAYVVSSYCIPHPRSCPGIPPDQIYRTTRRPLRVIPVPVLLQV